MKDFKWINSAKRRRIHQKFRRHLCRFLNCPFDSCFTTSELWRDARELQKAGALFNQPAAQDQSPAEWTEVQQIGGV